MRRPTSTLLSFDSGTRTGTDKEWPEQNSIDPCSAYAEVHALATQGDYAQVLPWLLSYAPFTHKPGLCPMLRWHNPPEPSTCRPYFVHYAWVNEIDNTATKASFAITLN